MNIRGQSDRGAEDGLQPPDSALSHSSSTTLLPQEELISPATKSLLKIHTLPHLSTQPLAPPLRNFYKKCSLVPSFPHHLSFIPHKLIHKKEKQESVGEQIIGDKRERAIIGDE
uniref:Uncharacterized protein n=1 Tax=Brassica oleracea var. oleracea TaxID=109376 RepID=A0A0D3DYY6_BRAOL